MVKLIINSAEVKARAVYMIGNLDTEKTPKEVVIREYKANRTAAQNSLLWAWNTAIANELGETKGDVHDRHKEQFLVPIYERDDTGYAEMMATLRDVYRDDKDSGLKLFRKIVKLTSTTTADTKQFTEFLNEIEAYARGLNIYLPHPGDYNLAMGIAA